jgi:hypothetical protein
MNRHSGLIIVLACVVVMGSLVVRPSIGQTDSSPAIQRWEYKIVSLQEIAMKAADSKSIGDVLETEFNALGEKGWSLAKMDQGVAVFEKRTK